jgi:hypothetical protein
MPDIDAPVIRLVTDAEVRELFEFLAEHPLVPPAFTAYNPAQAVLVFCCNDPEVAASVVALHRRKLAPVACFSGGLGKDSGPVLTEYGVPEAVFQAALAEQAGIPFDDLVIEPKAKNGGDNCRLGYGMLTERLGREPASLILVMPAVRARRLTEQFRYTAPHSRGGGGRVVRVEPSRSCPTELPARPKTTPSHRKESCSGDDPTVEDGRTSKGGGGGVEYNIVVIL